MWETKAEHRRCDQKNSRNKRSRFTVAIFDMYIIIENIAEHDRIRQINIRILLIVKFNVAA